MGRKYIHQVLFSSSGQTVNLDLNNKGIFQEGKTYKIEQYRLGVDLSGNPAQFLLDGLTFVGKSLDNDGERVISGAYLKNENTIVVEDNEPLPEGQYRFSFLDDYNGFSKVLVEFWYSGDSNSDIVMFEDRGIEGKLDIDANGKLEFKLKDQYLPTSLSDVILCEIDVENDDLYSDFSEDIDGAVNGVPVESVSSELDTITVQKDFINEDDYFTVYINDQFFDFGVIKSENADEFVLKRDDWDIKSGDEIRVVTYENKERTDVRHVSRFVIAKGNQDSNRQLEIIECKFIDARQIVIKYNKEIETLGDYRVETEREYDSNVELLSILEDSKTVILRLEKRNGVKGEYRPENHKLHIVAPAVAKDGSSTIYNSKPYSLTSGTKYYGHITDVDSIDFIESEHGKSTPIMMSMRLDDSTIKVFFDPSVGEIDQRAAVNINNYLIENESKGSNKYESTRPLSVSLDGHIATLKLRNASDYRVISIYNIGNEKNELEELEHDTIWFNSKLENADVNDTQRPSIDNIEIIDSQNAIIYYSEPMLYFDAFDLTNESGDIRLSFERQISEDRLSMSVKLTSGSYFEGGNDYRYIQDCFGFDYSGNPTEFISGFIKFGYETEDTFTLRILNASVAKVFGDHRDLNLETLELIKDNKPMNPKDYSITRTSDTEGLLVKVSGEFTYFSEESKYYIAENGVKLSDEIRGVFEVDELVTVTTEGSTKMIVETYEDLEALIDDAKHDLEISLLDGNREPIDEVSGSFTEMFALEITAKELFPDKEYIILMRNNNVVVFASRVFKLNDPSLK